MEDILDRRILLTLLSPHLPTILQMLKVTFSQGKQCASINTGLGFEHSDATTHSLKHCVILSSDGKGLGRNPVFLSPRDGFCSTHFRWFFGHSLEMCLYGNQPRSCGYLFFHGGILLVTGKFSLRLEKTRRSHLLIIKKSLLFIGIQTSGALIFLPFPLSYVFLFNYYKTFSISIFFSVARLVPLSVFSSIFLFYFYG